MSSSSSLSEALLGPVGVIGLEAGGDTALICIVRDKLGLSDPCLSAEYTEMSSELGFDRILSLTALGAVNYAS